MGSIETTPEAAPDPLDEFFERLERVAINLARTSALTLDEARRLVLAETLKAVKS